MQAVAYLRYSSDRQGEGDSLRGQTDLAQAYCASRGMTLERIVTDEGKSAFKGHHVSNGELGKLLREIDLGTYRGYAFLIEEVDRLSRQGVLKTFELIARFLAGGMEVHEINTARVIRELDDLDTADTGILTAVRGILAKESSRKLRARLLAIRQEQREQARRDKLAYTARCPSWCMAEPGEKPELIEERAETVRRVFELAGFGLGGRRIVNTLIAEGRSPFSNGKQGQAWTREFIQDLLSNRSVLGEFQPHQLVEKTRQNGKKVSIRVPVGEPIPDFFPPVVSREQWQAARHSVDAKNRNGAEPGGNRGGGRQGVNSLFSPLVYDADNGATMLFHHNQKRGEHPYLVSKWQSGKKSHYLRYDRFETAFLGFLSDLDWQSLAGEAESAEVKASRAELETVLAEIEKCQRRLASLRALVAEGSFSRSLFEAVDGEEARLADYSGKRERLASELAMARSRATALESPEDLLAIIRSGDPATRLRLKAEIRKRISRIEISFGLDGFEAVADVQFINGVQRGIIFDSERALCLRIEGSL